ncbi:site-specific integrase [bacterium]|nr:site-specific integrase [bacterium]
MANIQKRESKSGVISYRALVRIKGHPVQSRTFTQRTKAVEWAKRTEIDIRDGKYLPSLEANRRTVSELIDRYIAEELPKKQNKNHDVSRHLEIWRSLIGAYALIAIKTDILTWAINKIAAMPTPHGGTKSPATMNRYIASLSVVFSYGYKNLDWLSHNPIEKVRKYKEPRGRVRYLSDDERERLLSACKESHNPMLYPAVLLGIISGARKEELLSLQWPDVDLYVDENTGRAILQDTKNNERRTIPIVEPVLSLLRDMERVRGTAKYVFSAKRLDTRKGHANINHAWYEALSKAGISNFRFHDLRHTAASYLAMQGASLAEIADILGHKTLQMTKRYSHLSDQHKQTVVKRIMSDTIFGGTK